MCKVSQYCGILEFEDLSQHTEMDNPKKDCRELVECTAAVLDGDILQALFLSTQQIQVEVCIYYSTR
jgi:hypothetical protein